MRASTAACILAVVLVGFLFPPAAAQEGELEPVPSTARQDSLLRVGLGYHGSGRYAEAIAVYESVLEENPDNVIALGEIAYSCISKGDYERALTYARLGVKYRSPVFPILCMHEGTALDNLGRVDEGIAAFRKGLASGQHRYLFLYNIGFAFYRKSELDSARTYFQGALVENPRHASSNFALAMVYNAKHKKAPEILALARFLILEPDSPRSPDALQHLQTALGSDISSRGGKPERIELSFAPDSDAVDGDTGLLDLSVTIAAAASMTDGEKKTDVEIVAEILGSLFRIMREHGMKENPAGFCWNYYAPYFAELEQNGHTEALSYHIFRSTEDKTVATWLKFNDPAIKKLAQWDGEYAWR